MSYYVEINGAKITKTSIYSWDQVKEEKLNIKQSECVLHYLLIIATPVCAKTIERGTRIRINELTRTMFDLRKSGLVRISDIHESPFTNRKVQFYEAVPGVGHKELDFEVNELTEEISYRLRQYYKSKRITQKYFLHCSNVSAYIFNKQSFYKDFKIPDIYKICKAWPDLSINWAIGGVGEMIINEN